MDRPGFSFLVCPDSELLKQHIRGLMAGPAQGYESRAYWADEDDLPSQFWQDLTSTGLFGTKKIVILRNAHKLSVNLCKQLTPYLAGFSDNTWPVFCLENDWKGGKKPTPSIPATIRKQKFFVVAQKKGWIWENPGLDASTLPQYVNNWAQERHVVIPNALMPQLLGSLPLNACALSNELEKMDLALGERRELTREDLSLISVDSSIELWQFLANVVEGKITPEVWREVLRERSSSDSLLFPLNYGLVTEARNMWMMLHGEAPKMPDWLRRKKEQVARRVGVARLAKFWELAINADYSIKSGEKSEQQALEELISGLYALFQNPAR